MSRSHIHASPSIDSLTADAQAAELEGRWQQAREHYDRALYALCGSGKVVLAGSLLRWIARTHMAEGNLELAAEVAEVALHAAEQAGDVPGVARANNVLGNVERERGELAQAAVLYTDARRQAQAAGDTELVALVEQNLGIVATIRGDFRDALRHYRTSLATHRMLGSSSYVAHVLNNLAVLCTNLRRWTAAERAYAEAMEVCAELGDEATRARIAGNRIELLIARGRWAQAREACARAKELAQAAGEVTTLGEIEKHLGVIARETGHRTAAALHLASALRIAETRGDPVLEAETAREQARLHWDCGEHRETLQALNRAHRLFSRLQARRDLADVDEQIRGLESLFLNIVEQWGQSIESADRYTQGHCERVANYACALASAAGVEEDVLLWFRMGALLHDVGKIVVPPDVLNKPGKLEPDERRLIERHPDAGVELIGDIDFPWDIRPMVRHHHEAWDGSGYPAGLAGEQIPLSARILCVADVYDALATDRPYRRAFGHQKALDIMAAEAGTRLDPALFSLFRELDLGGSTALAAA